MGIKDFLIKPQFVPFKIMNFKNSSENLGDKVWNLEVPRLTKKVILYSKIIFLQKISKF